jgi:hypothetical protein
VEEADAAEAEAEAEERDTESKTRTPHKDVENNVSSISDSSFNKSKKSKKPLAPRPYFGGERCATTIHISIPIIGQCAQPAVQCQEGGRMLGMFGGLSLRIRHSIQHRHLQHLSL